MNHTFLIQVHKSPKLLRRILERISGDNHYFFINIDKKVRNVEEFENQIRNIKNVMQISHINVMHGGFSQVVCTIKQFRYASSLPLDFQYFHTISGQDYPCVSMETFDAFFECNDRSYMMLDTDEEAKKWKKKKYPHRLDHWYFMDVLNKPWMCKVHLAGIVRRLLYWVPRKKFDQSLIWGGWNWFSLHRDVVEFIIDYFDQNKLFINRFHYTTSSDELVFSSIIYPYADILRIEKRNSLRYIDWNPQRECSSLPLILDERDYDDIISSGAFFCRKVDLIVSKTLIDMLDAHVSTEDF